jgi:hypothetical protein
MHTYMCACSQINTLALWNMGRMIEPQLGAGPFLTVYLGSGGGQGLLLCRQLLLECPCICVVSRCRCCRVRQLPNNQLHWRLRHTASFFASAALMCGSCPIMLYCVVLWFAAARCSHRRQPVGLLYVCRLCSLNGILK